MKVEPFTFLSLPFWGSAAKCKHSLWVCKKGLNFYWKRLFFFWLKINSTINSVFPERNSFQTFDSSQNKAQQLFFYRNPCFNDKDYFPLQEESIVCCRSHIYINNYIYNLSDFDFTLFVILIWLLKKMSNCYLLFSACFSFSQIWLGNIQTCCVWSKTEKQAINSYFCIYKNNIICMAWCIALLVLTFKATHQCRNRWVMYVQVQFRHSFSAHCCWHHIKRKIKSIRIFLCRSPKSSVFLSASH